MCISKLGQVVYGALALASVGLILAALFTPGWRQVKGDFVKSVNEGNYEAVLSTDLFGFTCVYTSDKNSTAEHSNKLDLNNCVDWFKNQQPWEKVVAAGMLIALLAALFAFVWNLLTFCACFCKGTIHRPLGGLAANAAFFLAVSLLVYYYNNKDTIEMIKEPSIVEVKKIDVKNNVSYSFYMACGALAAQLTNVVVGALIVFFADKCL